MHEMCQQNRQRHSLFSVKLDLLTMSLHTFLLLTSSYDACKPSLMRLRLTSAPKAISLFSICCLAASANQCRNSEISASGSARSHRPRQRGMLKEYLFKAYFLLPPHCPYSILPINIYHPHS